MVFFYTSRCGKSLYVGRDKYENETLISYGWETDVWFHVADLSSAHVYLRQSPGETLDDITPDLLLDCCSLVKANSIEGCKKNHVSVIYTRWKNLKKTSEMSDGAVSFFRPANVRTVDNVEKSKDVVKLLEKTKREESSTSWHELKLANEAKTVADGKDKRRQEDKLSRAAEKEALRIREERSYDRVMERTDMKSNVAEGLATEDSSAADKFEEDFF